MSVWQRPDEVPTDLGHTVVTVGVFDGVHRGHQAVVGRAATLARELGVPLVAMTFDPNPLVVVRPEVAPPSLVSVDRRARLLTEAGADHVLVVPFDRARSEQQPDDFVEELVVGRLHAKAVVVGTDFRFGHRAAGDVALLQRMGSRMGPGRDFVVDVVEPVGDSAAGRWSSTDIRKLVIAGDVAGAAEMLGRRFRVEGVVVRGHERGRAMGFPTANVPARDGEVVPADGVYAGRLTRLDVDGAEPWAAAVSVGTNPTFDGEERVVEAYVLDRDDLDLYGLPVAVDFVARIRGQERFESVDDLVARMHLDVAETRAAMGL
ncbi:MAG: bifunctional riboflavin kinase/FAD synthetase [Jiangellaceae bacterium]